MYVHAKYVYHLLCTFVLNTLIGGQRGKASVLLLEGCWFDSPGLHVKVSLGKILNSKTAPDVLVCTLHGSHHHQCMNICMIYCKLFWTKVSAKCPKMQNYFCY